MPLRDLIRTRRVKFTMTLLLVYLAGGAVFVVAGVPALLWTAGYFALLGGFTIGGWLGYKDGVDDGARWTREAIQRGMVMAAITVSESVESVDDDDRRKQAPNN